MKVWLSVLVTMGCVALAPVRAHAQVNEGDFRLGFDLSLVSFNSARIKADAPVGDYDRKDNAVGGGTGSPVFGNAGVVLGYAATRHIVPSLYLSFQQLSLKGEEEEGPAKRKDRKSTRNQLEVRPQLELTLRPGTHFVPYGVLGLSYVRRASSAPDTDSFGIGPVLGVGAHAFASSLVSVDFSLTFRALFVNDDDREDALEARGLDDVKFREYAVFFNFGVSFWL